MFESLKPADGRLPGDRVRPVSLLHISAVYAKDNKKPDKKNSSIANIFT